MINEITNSQVAFNPSEVIKAVASFLDYRSEDELANQLLCDFNKQATLLVYGF
ncbi:hypothetical protein RO3G_06531 [Rhizopus delemar RA 99-880]|uniref:Uncharacterized protein n=1 Tax=Rhizopus delemar (strain RA 99-880 / ATCC MYA-4621 / FGSC 9543 / NRRL 43880) TaxID=246409 RepID=I1C046_RHIO9|nr:hypothetical protein RO3G_06531 [Rhizopus delemar RA 99-880]|eukprot:EIE81826.1 hypothetical protein RO3G_06531 [Rhizopus delemar RA 99-880]